MGGTGEEGKSGERERRPQGVPAQPEPAATQSLPSPPQAGCPAGAPSEVKEKFAEKKQINRFPLQQPLTL